MRLNVRPQNSIHAGLIPLAGVLKELQHFGINAQRDLFLAVRQLLCGLHPNSIGQAWRIALVNLLIGH